MNIEDDFLKFKPKNFPNENDYISIYKRLKYKLDKQIHPEVKVKMKEYHPDDYYNDHGIDHIKMVIDRVSRIVECLNPNYTKKNQKDKYYISPYEIFILLMAIQIHDAGHVLGTRKEHPQKAKSLLSKLDLGEELSTPEKKMIGDIAKAHSGTINNPIGNLPTSFDLSHQNIRPQFLASLLRLGDELAEDHTRASRFLIENDEVGETSKIYHQYSLSINSVKLSGKEISIKFYLDNINSTITYKKQTDNGIIDVYLIDEIYERTFKTFTEALYCGRFLPENCRYNLIKVTIYIDDAEHEQIIDPIGYEIMESDYPLINFKGKIFDHCKDLKIGDLEKDGKYFADLINSKK